MTNSSNILDFLKPKEILIYCKKTPLVDTVFKNRSVFDEEEIDFLYVDFNFYNKKFDEEEWEVSFEFKASKMFDHGKKEIASMEINVTVSPNQNLVSASDFYGYEEKGEYWDEGEYCWDVYCDGRLLLSKDFYIEPVGVVDKFKNPYFDVLSVKLFEGPSTLPLQSDRTYLSKYRYDATRYIWVELEILNKNPQFPWKGEFFFNFYNDIKELVGREVKLETIISGDNNTVILFAGIGSDETVTWAKDNYTVEIVFMESVQAIASFEVADIHNRGELLVEIPQRNNCKEDKIIEVSESEEKIFNEIDKLVGLEKVKSKLHEYYYFAKYIKLRQEKGVENKDELNLNFVFTGNPGTGKTTIAKMLGKIYKSLGLLSKENVFEVDRGDLIGRYIGETAPQTKEVIEKARGGILFIDEAYSLFRGDEKDFGREAIEVLVKELSDGPGDISIIVAGYPKEMKIFIESNPGLKSRFNNWYEFDDYIPDDLFEIARVMAKKKSLIISKGAEQEFEKIIIEAYRNKDRTFGNARFVSSLIEEAQVNLGMRVMQSDNPSGMSLKEISTIQQEDVIKIIDKSKKIAAEFPVDEMLLKKSLKELNSLTGLSKVKTEISEIVKLVRFYKENKKEVLNSLSLHNVFIGNPGTGKTTVARILANIYKALGLLEKGHLVECSRDSLVAGYVGQTAIKTKDKIDESIGGVLFIDEAYALTKSGNGSDFGGEAIEVILKAMEDRRGKFSLITAGYTHEMINFLDSNPGLKSRFDNTIEFDDFDPDDLIEIAINMLNERNVKIDNKAKEHLIKLFAFHHANKDRFFGNARFVRKIIDESVKNIYIRLSDLPQDQRTDDMMHLLTLKDVEEFTPSKDILKKRKIGF